MNYNTIKGLFTQLFPKSFQNSLTPFIRLVLRIYYKGSKYVCPVENHTYRAFIRHKYIDHIELLSPYSGVMARQRNLWLLLEKEVSFDQKLAVLQFSPNKFFEHQIKKKTDWNYFSTDFETPDSDLNLDITHIDLEDESQDIIICYHVLEHIPDDSLAMKELYRILKKDGLAYLQVPFTENETLEKEEYNTPELRLKYYWQQDHVRLYGREDFIKRLSHVGFKVVELKTSTVFTEVQISTYGLKRSERVFVCRKTRDCDKSK